MLWEYNRALSSTTKLSTSAAISSRIFVNFVELKHVQLIYTSKRFFDSKLFYLNCYQYSCIIELIEPFEKMFDFKLTKKIFYPIVFSIIKIRIFLQVFKNIRKFATHINHAVFFTEFFLWFSIADRFIFPCLIFYPSLLQANS